MSYVSVKIAVCIVIGYFLGSLNPAYLIAKMHGYNALKDGSGNPGASNALIIAGKKAGFFVGAFDVCKSAVAWKICAFLFPELNLAGILGGVSAILGHMYSVFLRFRGGKGLACMAGVVLAYRPSVFLLLLGVAAMIILLTDYIVFVTVGMSYIWPIFFGMTTGFLIGALVLAIPAIPITWKHRINFKRIMEGTELRFSYLWRKDKELERIGRGE